MEPLLQSFSMQLEVSPNELGVARPEDSSDLVLRHVVRPEHVLGPADHQRLALLGGGGPGAGASTVSIIPG